jgi:hypothetical protein
MARIVDNLIAFRILSMLVTNFEDTDAFKLGIIDAKGKALKKSAELTTSAEKEAYTYLHRLVFTMKKIINKFGGETKLKSLVAALWLVKEYYESGSRTTSLMEERYAKIVEVLDNNVTLAEEEILVKKFMAEEGVGVAAVGGAPTNNTAGASVKEPVVGKKDIKKYRGTIARRPQLNIPEIKP